MYAVAPSMDSLGAGASGVAERRPSYGARRLPESILHAAWRRAGRSELVLKSGEGRSYRVLYPGKPAGGQGPDFVDAVIETEDGSRLCGDIEIHVRSSDWHSHGHSGDPRYNGVLFHVALADSGAEAVTRSGRPIPLLVMGSSAARPSTGHGVDAPVRGGALAVPFLDVGAAGDERFANKSEGCSHEIRFLGADQAAYEALLDCMGFPGNRAGFRRLARRLPWNELAPHAGHMEECLMWAAGLGTRPDNAPGLRGAAPEWQRAGRPDNRPERRIRGIARILEQSAGYGGPAEYCMQAVRETDAKGLLSWFGVPGDKGRALIGRGRALEMLVNAVLPFSHAMGSLSSDGAVTRLSMERFRDLPAPPPNGLVREARTVLSAVMDIPEKPTAREQQGLIHAYRLMTSKIVRPRQLPLV